MKKNERFFISLLLIGLCVACGNSKNTETESHSSLLKTYFVHGDPKELIKGTTLNQQSFITLGNVDQFNNFEISSISQFTEKEEAIALSHDITEGQESTENDATKVIKPIFNFVRMGNSISYISNEYDISLNFRNENGVLQLFQLRSEEKNEVLDVKVLHYSLLTSGDAFSILLEANDSENGSILVSLTFVKNTPKHSFTNLSKKYKYLYGPGVPVKWNQSKALTLHICGEVSTKVDEIYSAAIYKTWRTILRPKIGVPPRLKLEVAYDEKYPPFNDLNYHCIYTVNNYLTEQNPEFINSASTLTVSDRNKGEILDSDIFVWSKEREKQRVPLDDNSSLRGTILHEIGHFLGLDHQFDGTPSIMSYGRTDNEIKQYDLDAIYELYQ